MSSLYPELYRPLDINQHEIRLIKIAPGASADSIECDLEVISLRDDHEFEALSYCWGDTIHQAKITVASYDFSVTENLESALRHLRHLDKVRRIWIDQLCINQTDDAEKSHQVPHMGSIYSNATQTIVWLGEGSDQTRRAFEFITTVARDGSLHWSSSHYPYVNPAILDDTDNGPMVHLLTCPWWSRVWTVQEYILAKKLDFMAGDQVVSKDTFDSMIESYHKHSECCCIPGGPDGPLPLAMIEPQKLNQYRSDKDDDTTFSYMLRRFQRRQCKDPRDHIYGYLSLATGPFRDICLPDYTMQSTEQVYEEFTLQSIHRMNNLRDFGYVYRQKPKHGIRIGAIPRFVQLKNYLFPPTTKLVLPSWVPDYSVDIDYLEEKRLSVRDVNVLRYSAGRSKNLNLERQVPGMIAVEGVYIDTVAQSAMPQNLDSQGLPSGVVYLAWHRDVANSRSAAQRYDYSAEDGYWCINGGQPTVLFHLIVSNSMVNNDFEKRRTFGEEDFAIHKKWWECIRATPRHHKNWDDPMVNTYDFMCQCACLRRRFFISSTGYVGLMPEHALNGDVIVVFYGSHVPHVLRKTKNADQSGRECYKLVGDAYVHGIMDGEALVPDPGRSHQAQTFILV